MKLLLLMFATALLLAAPVKAQIVVKVHTYSETGEGSVNSYWIETPKGIVIVDAQRTISSAKKLVRQIQPSGKPVVGVFLTHEHPDHFGGWSVLAKACPKAHFYLSQSTLNAIRNDDKGWLKLGKKLLKSNFSTGVPTHTKIIHNGETLILAGIHWQVREMGAGEAETMTMLYLPDQHLLFSGDVVQDRMTPFLIEGRTGLWLRQLDTIAVNYKSARVLYPGHGRSGAPAPLIARQREYLITMRRLISGDTDHNTKTLTPNQKAGIARKIAQNYPHYFAVAEIPHLIEANVDGVAKELGNVPHETKEATP